MEIRRKHEAGSQVPWPSGDGSSRTITTGTFFTSSDKPIAEQQDQHHRHHNADGDAARIADDLPRFLAHQRPERLQLGGRADGKRR